MTNTDNATPFDTTPADACEAIAAFGGDVLIDLDETLYLRNSTEDFLSAARPAVLALLALSVLDAFRPWCLSGGEATRDIWRLRTIMFLFPWTLWRWRKQVLRLGLQHRNNALAAVRCGRTGLWARPPRYGGDLAEPARLLSGKVRSRRADTGGWTWLERAAWSGNVVLKAISDTRKPGRATPLSSPPSVPRSPGFPHSAGSAARCSTVAG